MKRGYGQLIAERRAVAGLSPEQLTERLGRKSKSVVYRLESEDQEPTVADINALTATLPMSAEELLRAMGVNLTAPLAAKIPRPILERLAAMTQEQHVAFLQVLDALAVLRDRPESGPVPR